MFEKKYITFWLAYERGGSDSGIAQLLVHLREVTVACLLSDILEFLLEHSLVFA